MSGVSIYNKYKGETRFANGTYYDPDGADVGLALVGCTECFFKHGDRCIIYLEKGYLSDEISAKMRSVRQEQYCDYFLSDFIDDEAARKEISDLKDEMFGRSASSPDIAPEKKRGCIGSMFRLIFWAIIGLIALRFALEAGGFF